MFITSCGNHIFIFLLRCAYGNFFCNNLLCRIKPSVIHEPFKPRLPKHGSEFSHSDEDVGVRYFYEHNEQIQEELMKNHMILSFNTDSRRVDPIPKLVNAHFNYFQLRQKEELQILTKWYKDMEFQKISPYARELVLDDTFDAYATIEELRLLTYAINRISKPFYKIILNEYAELEKEAVKKGRANVVNASKQALLTLLSFKKWFLLQKPLPALLLNHLSSSLSIVIGPFCRHNTGQKQVGEV